MEIEYKFQIPPERIDTVEAAMREAGATRTRLQARYHDTADGMLARRGVALRLRKEGRHWVQTVKALGDGPVHRLEHNAEVPLRKGAQPTVLVTRHDGTPAGERLAAALAQTSAPLVEVYGTDIWRSACRQQFGSSTIELALDQGRVVAPATDGGAPRTSQVCELELELVEGTVADLAGLARLWADRHGLWFSTLTKAERGLRLARGMQAVPAVKAAPPLLDTRHGFPDGPRIQRAVVAACLAQILPNATEVAAGSEDAEQIHQLRVGLRRLRTALRELAPLADGFDPAWHAPLAECFQALGATRDRQQILGALLPRLQAAGGPAWSLDDAAAPAPAAGAAVRAGAFQSALIDLIALAAGAQAQAQACGLTPRAARSHLRRRLHRLHAQVVRASEAFETLPIDAQHQVRKRLKRLRYLAGFVGACFDARAAARTTRRLAPAQDALGTYVDDMVGLEQLRALAATEPRAWFGVGWLQARLPQGARAARKALRALKDLPAFWKG